MTTRNLAEAILDGGIRSVNFFNGRLLSGEDLSQEQVANSEERKRLGQAIGDGIVSGLEVTNSTTAGNTGTPIPTVTVQPGLAINRLGQTLMLTSSVDVSLVASSAGATAASQSLFATCVPPQSGPYIAGAGVYLLTIAPTTGSEGRAPVSGLGNVSAFCNTRYNIEGVQFHLLQVNVAQNELQDSNHLRNLLAYECFGTSAPPVQTFLQDPLGSSVQQGYGLLDTMRQGSAAACLSDADVPLALLYWTVDAGIDFIDLWSVRRRITRPSADTHWPLFISDRRLSEAEAMFLQFEEQIAQMTDPVTGQAQLTQIGVLDSFRYLPPVGIIPFASSSLSRGFDYLKFFLGIPYRDPVFIEGAKVECLIRDSLSYQPITLDSNPNNQEMIWLYLVRENMQAIAANPLNPPQANMIFASGYIPYQGDAQYNLARWSYSNYSLTMAQ